MIIENHGGKYYHHRIPGIVCTGFGSFLAYYECRKSDSDWSEIDIKIIRSSDNGKTWQTVKIISSKGQTFNNPVMIAGGDSLHFLFCENYKRVFHSVSTDDGVNWSVPIEITEVFDHIEHTVVALGPGHGLTLCDGTMIIPVWFALNNENKKAHRPSFVSTLYSKDNGITWCVGEIINSDILVNPSECAVALLSDDSVVMSIRNENDCRLRFFAKSPDGYEKWLITGFDERFSDPVCQGSMINSGKSICHINCDDKTGRRNLTLKITTDDFKTIKKLKIDDCGGYSDLCVKNDTAYIIYEDTTDTDDEYYVNLKFRAVKI